SSRRRHTRCLSDWSSDVCSSDLTVPGQKEPGRALAAAHAFDIEAAKARLAAANGGYEIVHESAGLELGVYVLVAPEADDQQPHEIGRASCRERVKISVSGATRKE